MADQVLDKLIFALAGDTAPLQSAFAQAEAGAARTGATIQKNIGGGFKAAGSDVSKHAQDLNGLRAKYDEAFAAQQRLAKGRADINTLLGAGAISQPQAAKMLQDMEKAAGGLGNNINVSRREMVYFVRELATGDIQRMPATLALLASHFLELSGGAIVAGAAIAAFPIALAVAAEKADAALAKLRTSIALTGGASGVSVSQATTMAAAAAGQGHLSEMGAEKVVGGLLGASVPSGSVQQAAAAVGNYSLATGSTQEQAISEVSKIFQDPAAEADALNKSMHLLTAAQTEQVKTLSAQGEKEKAADIILEEFAQRTKEAADGASAFSKATTAAGNWFGDIGHRFALGLGGGSAQQKLDVLNGPINDRPFGIFQGLVTPRAGLEKQVADENAKAKAAGVADTGNQLILQALPNVERGTGAFAKKLEDLQNQFDLDTKAAGAAGQAWQKNSKDAKAAADAAKLWDESYTMGGVVAAVKKYGSPEAQAAQRLKDARELAGASQEDQPIVAARQAAYARYRENAQNPEAAASADAVLKMDMAGANLAGANKAKEQEKNLQVMKDQAVAAQKVADAYGVSTAAAERAKVEGEVDVEITNRTIAAKDRLAAINYKLALSYAQASEAVNKEIETLKIANAGLAAEVAASGSPTAIAAAKRSAEVERAVQGETPEQAAMDRFILDDQYRKRDEANSQITLNSAHRSATQNLGNLQGQAGAFFGGASDDDIRHLKIYQDAVDQVSKEFDKGTPLYNQYLQQLVATNTQISDLTDSLQKAQKEAQGMADAITGSLGNFLSHPKQVSPLDALANAGQGVLNQLVQTQILEPMNKWLTSQFAGLLGGPTQLGASIANPMYVVPIGAPGSSPLGPGGGNPFTGPAGPGSTNLNPFSSGSSGSPSLSQIYGGNGSTLFGGNAMGFGGLFGRAAPTVGPYSAAQLGAGDLSGLDLSLPDLSAATSSAGSLSGYGASAMGAGDLSGLDISLPDLSGATSAASSGGFLSSIGDMLASFAGLFDDGGTISPGQWGIKSGKPEIITGGTSGISVLPFDAPVVQAALGSQGGPGGTSYGGAGNSSIDRGGDTFHFHLPGVTDVTTFLRSKSQMQAAVTSAASAGRRNR